MSSIAKLPLPDGKEQFTVFRDWSSIIKHIRNHLLTNPECNVWKRVSPKQYIQAVGDSLELAVRERCSQELKAETSPATELYNLYTTAIKDAINDATQLGWWVASSRDSILLFGLTGLFAVIKKEQRAEKEQWNLLSAYIPNKGNPKNIRKQTSDGPRLSRESFGNNIRNGNPKHSIKNKAEQKRDEKRKAKRSPKESYYYDVFRPALQFLRSAQIDGFSVTGRSDDILELRKYLPKRKKVSLKNWLDLIDKNERQVS